VKAIKKLGHTQEISSNQKGAARNARLIAAKEYAGKIELATLKVLGIAITYKKCFGLGFGGAVKARAVERNDSDSGLT
jgi:hypothetical protein